MLKEAGIIALRKDDQKYIPARKTKKGKNAPSAQPYDLATDLATDLAQQKSITTDRPDKVKEHALLYMKLSKAKVGVTAGDKQANSSHIL